jgi:hypothetical protein
MDLIDRIDEATKKPSFTEYFFAKKNFKKLEKQFRRYQEDQAMEYGNDIVDDDQYYSEEDREFEEIDPAEAYDSYAHTMGYAAEWDAAHYTILDNKSKYDYKRGDESDQNEYVDDFIDYMGFSTSFGSFRHSKTKQDYWKEYGGK